jgi:hypothetical protein
VKIDEGTRSSSSRPCAAWVMCSTYRRRNRCCFGFVGVGCR